MDDTKISVVDGTSTNVLDKTTDTVTSGDESSNPGFDLKKCNIDLTYTHEIEVFIPKDGQAMLSPDQISIPSGNNIDLVSVPYNERRRIQSIKFIGADPFYAESKSGNSDNADCDIGVDYESVEGPEDVSIYRHNIFGKYIQTKDGSSEKYWEAFDIPFNPDWKSIVSLKFKGITKSTIAIVRLLSNMNDGSASSFLTMYIQNNSTSSYLNNEYSKYLKEYASAMNAGKPIDRKTIQDFCITYPENLIQDKTYGYFVSALAYAYYINGNKPFIICEQIMDYRHNGETELLLSNSEAKTEIRREYNIFANNLPRSVFTNYVVPTFICTYKNGYYIIRKFIHKNVI